MRDPRKDPSFESFGQEEPASSLAELDLSCPTEFRTGAVAVLTDAFADPVTLFGNLLFWSLFGLIGAGLVGTVALFFLSGMPLGVATIVGMVVARKLFRPC